MKNLDWLQVLRSGRQTVQRCWRPMAGYMLTIWLVGLAILVPLTSWALYALAARSGEFVIGLNELLGWLQSPAGITYLLLAGSLTFLGMILQLAGLILIAKGDCDGVGLSLKEVLVRVLFEFPNLFYFCLIGFLVCLILLLPLAAGLGAVYLSMLTEHDINFYLSTHPPAWQWALTASAVWTLLWACGAGILILRWIYILPAWLDGHRPLRRIFRVSWEATRGKLSQLLCVIGSCTVVWTIARLVIEGGLFAAAGFLIKRLDGSVNGILYVISAYLVITVLAEVIIIFFGLVWISAVLAICYRRHTQSTGLTEPVRAVAESERLPSISGHRLQPRFFLLLFGALLLISGAVNAWLLRQRPPDVTPLVIAHRAGALYAPENSLAALETAYRQGADYAEIDVQRTLDGVVVVVHDADLMKVAGDPRRIGQSTFADISEVDIGRSFGPEFTGERLTRLSDFLAKAKGRIKLMIELKYYGEDPLLAAETIRLVREHGMEEEVAIMSLNLKGVRQAQRLDAILRVGYLSSVDVGNLARLNVNFLALAAGKTTQDLITAARERGQSVYAWTVNDREMMLDMIELGTDGLITDNPALANDVIAQVMDLLPVERLLLRFRHFWNLFDERITAPVDPEE